MMEIFRQIIAFSEIALKKEKMWKTILVTIISIPFFIFSFWIGESYELGFEESTITPKYLQEFIRVVKEKSIEEWIRLLDEKYRRGEDFLGRKVYERM